MSNTDITSQIIEIIKPFFVNEHDLENTQLNSNDTTQIVPEIIAINIPTQEKNTNILEFTEEKIKELLINLKTKNISPLQASNDFAEKIIGNVLNNVDIPKSIDTGFGAFNFGLPQFTEESTEPISENTLYCEHCSFHTSDQIYLMDHTLIYHDGIFNEYMCEICNYICTSMHDLDVHINENHKTRTKSKTLNRKDENESEDEYDEENEEEILNKDKSENIDGKETEAKAEMKFKMESINDAPIKPIKKSIKKPAKKSSNLFEDRPKKKWESDEESEEDELPPLIHSKELLSAEISKQNLEKWSSISGKHQCQICKLKFRSQNHLGEHFMLNHQTYEEQLELDLNIITTSFPGFEVLSEIEYCSFPENEQYYEKFCDICCEEYLVNHNKKIKTINALFLEECDDKILYPIVVNCCKDNHACHKCVKEYLNESYLNGLLYCPFCQQDKTIRGLQYISVTEIECDKKTWKEWWSKYDRLNMIASL